MPRLSLYNPQKSNNFRYMDRIVKEQLYVGGTDLYIHKYIGPPLNTGSKDATQPAYDSMNPLNIEDLLFLETRNRKYDKDIYCLRGHYNVANLDFDMSQFGLFISNDIIFINVHFNEMIETFGRKIINGDVIELPHLTDYHPLNDTVPASLRRYYQVSDGSFSSEGYSATWYPHLWRIKCEPLVDSQEFNDILTRPLNEDTFLGDWNSTTPYTAGYTVRDGNVIYTVVGNPPVGTPITNTTYFTPYTDVLLHDVMTTYHQNIRVNQAALDQAISNTPAWGYNRDQLYIVTTHDMVPQPPIAVNRPDGPPSPYRGVIVPLTNVPAVNTSGLLLSAASYSKLSELVNLKTITLQLGEISPMLSSTGSGQTNGEMVLVIKSQTDDPSPPTDGSRVTPSGFGYADNMSGNGTAPNGIPTAAGTNFPSNPTLGDYFLRIDYAPQKLFRYNGKIWKQISENVRTGIDFDSANKSVRSSFVNNTNVTQTTTGPVPERQSLSKLLRIKPD